MHLRNGKKTDCNDEQEPSVDESSTLTIESSDIKANTSRSTGIFGRLYQSAYNIGAMFAPAAHYMTFGAKGNSSVPPNHPYDLEESEESSSPKSRS